MTARAAAPVPEPAHPEYLSAVQLGMLTGTHQEAVGRWLAAGLIPGAVRRGRYWAIPSAAVEFLPDPGDRLVSAGGAIAQLGISERRLDMLAADGQLGRVRLLPGGHRRFSQRRVTALAGELQASRGSR